MDRRPADVAGMFDAVAERYDVVNTLMTFGQDRRWRSVVAREVGIRAGERVLDVAAGTGASSVPFRRMGATVVACDFSTGMLRVGRAKHPELCFVAGDALALPFADGRFDAVTISFGLRNVADVTAALAELARVTRRGGRLVVLETSAPLRQPLRGVHGVYVQRVLPRIARRAASNVPAYAYLAESAAAWPSPQELADTIATTGWSQVTWRQLLFGAVAVHRAQRG